MLIDPELRERIATVLWKRWNREGYVRPVEPHYEGAEHVLLTIRSDAKAVERIMREAQSWNPPVLLAPDEAARLLAAVVGNVHIPSTKPADPA